MVRERLKNLGHNDSKLGKGLVWDLRSPFVLLKHRR
jgi:hypothetical protein